MANRTAWIAGNGQGLTYGSAISDAALATLANGNTLVASSVTVSNGSSLDQFCDISFKATIASSTIAAGANLAFWLYNLNQDGTTYGDGQFTPGTAANGTPAFPPIATVGLPALASTTSLWGTATGIVIVPGTFHFAVQNNSGFAFTACTIQYRTYNINLNS